ncbi:MAG TPA: DUF2218 domain-containing protein [Rhizomicrobium sp.]|jgi:hypothetical protein|nr:DUF2218 domain-containing protein [Rhizomicrobium sp.]
MTTSHARVRTEHASDYLIGLSKDWARDIPALAFDDRHAVIALPGARCELIAGDNLLDITLEAGSATQLVLLEHLLSGHLDSIARDEGLKCQWSFQ